MSAELFAAPLGLDAGFTLQFVPLPSIPGNWVGGVLTRSGDVICIPTAGSSVLRIASDGGISSIPLQDEASWEGGVLLADGSVLGLPYLQGGFVSVTNNGSARFVDAGLPFTQNQPHFEGGVLTLSQKVLLAPRTGVQPGVFDPATQILTFLDGGIPSMIGTEANYGGAVLLADGETAVMVPRNARQLMRVTPTEASLVAMPPALEGHSGGLLMPDGRVLLMATTEMAHFVIWDPVSGNVDDPNPTLPGSGYFSAAWSTNGYAYAIQTDGPQGNVNVAIIDRAGVVTEVQTDGGLTQNSHYGLVTKPDGVIVGCPNLAPTVLYIVPHVRRTVSIDTMTSPWLNKW